MLKGFSDNHNPMEDADAIVIPKLMPLNRFPQKIPTREDRLRLPVHGPT
jgi:hypothetical protein